MGSPRDMTAANWARAQPRLQANIAELRTYGAVIDLPPDFETTPQRVVPPAERAYSRGNTATSEESA